jgi:hypothetical protein
MGTFSTKAELSALEPSYALEEIKDEARFMAVNMKICEARVAKEHLAGRRMAAKSPKPAVSTQYPRYIAALLHTYLGRYLGT